MIEWQDLFTALALVIVLEGVLPFLNPGRFRGALELVNRLSDRQIRIMGAVCMFAGLLFLLVIR